VSPVERIADDRTDTRLDAQFRQLQLWLIAALAALVLSGASFSYHLFRQVSMIRKDLDSLNLAAQEYQTKREPIITNIVTQLQAYGQKNPDFLPILERYGISSVPPKTIPPSMPAQR
jgi:hypothetical protein